MPDFPQNIETFLRDIKEGLSDDEIIERHKISRKTFNSSLKAAIKTGAISRAEIDRRQDYFFRRIRRLAIIAMFSDDDLMTKLVLKGGNALDIVYCLSSRSSIDLDFSIETEFNPQQIDAIRDKMAQSLADTFLPEGFVVFDVTLVEKPPEVTPDMADFWGGYRIEFKLIRSSVLSTIGNDLASWRNYAEMTEPSARKKFRIDISKFEYCGAKQRRDLDHYTIYVYTPEHIVVEKLRSICQQMPEYGRIVKSQSQSARPKDFYDIYITMEYFGIDLTTPDNQELIRASFSAKKVPLHLIGRIHEYREYHKHGFDSVRDTIYPFTESKEFDFYFEYVIEKSASLKPLWKE